MRWGTVALLAGALAAGALLRAATAGATPMARMAATIGLFVLGLAGSIVLARSQFHAGRRRLERVLVGLGPAFVITDWAGGRPAPEAPDYVVVGPAGILAIVLDDSPAGRWAARRLGRARERAQHAAAWVAAVARGELPEGAVVEPVVALTRRPASPADRQGAVTVLEPEEAGAYVRRFEEPERLAADQRIRVTRRLRRRAWVGTPQRQGHGRPR
ncbi:hypothetical protein [Caldinitratiruptor microaerophilus]|uniref:NERD domain-containing protein n=1 Tax=Caldinitratiruptor microaerophilus TaxID=671077 RepID=A0AA35G9H8_9FIRM|nr:hypothetical protein [Caldinitratiruptor microaerophilus]BDG62106.1 hypothetical protein caldi_31960 [Caldinitratiruptor microaerophilus]